MSKISLQISIDDPANKAIAHKLIEIRPPKESGSVSKEEVVFDDWIPSGSYCTIQILRDDHVVYSEKKLIPNAPWAQEGAELTRVITGEILRTEIQSFKHRIDAWVRLDIDDHGAGKFECHVGNLGTDQRKAVFETTFKA